jgi:UDP-galactopyranose mutase
VEVHTHGSHIFHTSNDTVWEYVNRFTSFVPYEHRVRATARGRVFTLPVNLHTINQFYGAAFTPDEARAVVHHQRSGQSLITDLETKAIHSVGRPLYELLIKPYTMKQWGADPRDLPADTINRLPVRFTYDDRYFGDTHQGLPTDGYQPWLDRMADHPRITVTLSRTVTPAEVPTPALWTGPIDAFFGHHHGHLGWRAVRLEEDHPDVDDFQGCAVMNYADLEVPYTRIHEYRHLRPDRTTRGTVIHREYPDPGGPPAYPVNSPRDRVLLTAYREDADRTPGWWFGGRLGSYKYLDMHMAIASALTLWRNTIHPTYRRTP